MRLSSDSVRAVLSCLRKLIISDSLGINEITASPECSQFSMDEILCCLEYLDKNGYIIARFKYADDKIYEILECRITLKGKKLLGK